MPDRSVYASPLCGRYASEKMQRIFSEDEKFTTWRKLWVVLAESESELGLNISPEQIAQLKAHVDDIDYDKAAAYESKVRHDVMAHVLTYGDACPDARGVIHLGATSCYVGDNTDIIIMRKALDQIRSLLLTAIRSVAAFAGRYADVPTLAYTHFQAAQPTTVGKRATLWLQDLVSDLGDLDHVRDGMRLLGCKGTTGTQASFAELFDGDVDKIRALDELIAKKTGFAGVYPVSGQTYSRKLDFRVLCVLASIAQSAHKFSNDIRLLSHLKEFDEPFESGQIGSSAMAYKRNPMRSERMASLSRYVIADLMNPAMTASEQWFERTLDDSANRRISIPEAFLATDAILQLYVNVVSGGRIYEKICERHLRDELPFMATENILMYCVERKGGDRQALHESIRRHSVAAAGRVKGEGLDNDLLERIAADPVFGLTKDEIESIVFGSAPLVGIAPEQTRAYLAQLAPLLDSADSCGADDINIKV